MAEEVIIQVTTETDAAQLEELDSLVEEIREKATIDASVEVEDTSLDEASDKATTLEDELTNIDNTVVSPQVDTSGLDEASGKAEETASSMDNITTAAAGLAATAGIEQMATTADNINNSWNRLDLTLGSAGVSMDTVKSQVNSLSASTGRSGGVIRDYFNQMGIAGVTNTELLSSSFEALAGKSYQTGKDVGVMENALQRAVLSGGTGTMIMKNLGITTEDLGRAMGMTAEEAAKAFKEMTPEERLAAITKAMGDGAQANEMYKNSYAGLKERADAAMAGLMGAVGQAILPVVIPALQAATNAIKVLTDGFKSLPSPVQGAIGAVLGIAAIGTTLIGTLGMVGKVIGTVKTGLETIGMLGKITSVISTISGAFSSLWGVIIANPILLVVVAIAALVVAFIWAYNNVGWFRDMVNNAWSSIQGFAGWIAGVFTGAIDNLGNAFNNAGQTLQNAFTSAVEFVKLTLQGLYDYIMTLGGLLPEGVNITGNQIIDSILAVLMFISTLPMQLSMILMNIIANMLGFKGNFVQTMLTTAVSGVTNFINWISQLPGRVGNYLSNVISRVYSFGSSLVSSFVSSASSAVSNFAGQISSLPGKLQAELQNMLSIVGEWAATLPQKFWDAGVNAVRNFLNALDMHSPGIMQRSMVWEVSEMARRVPLEGKNLVSNIGELGSDIVDNFQPELGMDFDDTMNADIDGGAGGSIGAGQVNNFYFSDIVVDNEERMQRIVDYVRREIHWNNKTAGRTI